MPSITTKADIGGIVYLNSNTLLAATANGEIQFCDPQSGKLLQTVKAVAEGRPIQLSPDGKLFASATPASEGRKLLIGDTSNGRILHTLPAHGPEQIIRRFSFSRDSHTLLSGGDDKLIRAWDTATGAQRWASPGGIGEARFFAFSPDGKALFTADSDTDLRFFNPSNGELTRKVTDLALAQFAGDYSPDSKWLAFGGADRQIHLWDVPATKLVRSIPAGPHLVGSLLFSPDGKRLLSAHGDELGGRLPSYIRLWDPTTAKLIAEKPVSLPARIAFSPDSRHIAYTSNRKLIEIIPNA
jgi:WD40 repeat protein